MIGATPLEAGAPGANDVGRGCRRRSGRRRLRRGARPLHQRGAVVARRAAQGSAGQPLVGFKLDASPLAGADDADRRRRARRHRAGARQRPPGRSCSCATPRAAPSEEARREAPPLQEGEALFASSRAPLIAALDEGGGEGRGARRASRGSRHRASRTQVLHWDGSQLDARDDRSARRQQRKLSRARHRRELARQCLAAGPARSGRLSRRCRRAVSAHAQETRRPAGRRLELATRRAAPRSAGRRSPPAAGTRRGSGPGRACRSRSRCAAPVSPRRSPPRCSP